MAAPNDFFAQYQLGLARAQTEDWPAAAEAFERASQLDPVFAYAHYYAGLAYSRIQRIDRTATHFETFLKLAPKAPERTAVESIMRTLRGR
jgi:tetratricopeptide (TPR) repeat protein